MRCKWVFGRSVGAFVGRSGDRDGCRWVFGGNVDACVGKRGKKWCVRECLGKGKYVCRGMAVTALAMM